MKLKSIKSIKNLKGKKVLMRVAYDITLAKKGDKWVVPDNRRIVGTLPTIKYLLKQGCSMAFLSWLKRPNFPPNMKDKIGKEADKFRMDSVAKELSKLIKRPVDKVDDCVGKEVKEKVARLKHGDLLMLENVRLFHPEEMDNDQKFAKELTKGFDLIVFDAWAQSHRIHSSTVGIMKYLPTYAGFLLEKELSYLEKVTRNPKRPLTVIIGGAKVSDKINIIEFLVKKADYVLIGGGTANVFLKATGVDVGNSYMEDVFVDKAKRKKVDLVKQAKGLFSNNKNIILPQDLSASDKMDQKAKVRTIDLSKGDKINKKEMFLDIGPKTIKHYNEIIKKSKTILWSGPLGVFEINKFAKGTRAIALAIVKSKAVSIIGGGDTEHIVKDYHLEGKFTHVSTGGGAMLEFLEGKVLPGVKPLIKK